MKSIVVVAVFLLRLCVFSLCPTFIMQLYGSSYSVYEKYGRFFFFLNVYSSFHLISGKVCATFLPRKQPAISIQVRWGIRFIETEKRVGKKPRWTHVSAVNKQWAIFDVETIRGIPIRACHCISSLCRWKQMGTPSM